MMNNKLNHIYDLEGNEIGHIGIQYDWSKKQQDIYDDLSEKHWEFKQLFIGDRIYDKQENSKSIWVRKSENDFGHNHNNITECLIDNLLEKKFYLCSFIDESIDENEHRVYHQVYFYELFLV